MQATATLALFLIFVSMAAICGCTYDFDQETVPGFDQHSDEWNISEPEPVSIGEAEDLFSDFSKEYLHRDPAGSIKKIIGIKVGTEGKALNWIFGTKVNDEDEYYEVGSQGIIPMIWEMPLPEESINTATVVDLGKVIKKIQHPEGERTVIITEGKITITTKTEEEIKYSVIDAYSGEMVI